MWVVRSIAGFLVIVAILVFAIGNVENRTDVRLFTKTYSGVHLNLILLIATLLGAGITFLVMAFREISLRAANRKLRRETLRLDDELTALRNLPLSGIQKESAKTGSESS